MYKKCKNAALLCDYGLDDAVATAFLLERRDQFEKIDIVPIGGNLPLEIAHKNAFRLLYNAGGDLSGIRVVDTRAIAQPEKNLARIHGVDGMGDLLPEEYEELVPEISFEEWNKESREDYVVFSLGPCTVSELVVKAHPEIELILMAGNVAEKPNYEGREFNHALDVPAFAETVKHPHAAVTLDTSRSNYLNFNSVPLTSDTLMTKLACRYRDMVNMRHKDEVWVYDLYAVYYYFYPDRYTVEELTDPDGNKLSVLKYTYPGYIFS